MKRICLPTLILMLLPGLLLAGAMVPGPQPKALASPPGYRLSANRYVPAYTFTKNPTAIITNYYDYMIGSYNEIPLNVIPASEGGGYFMTYHGRRQATSTRRIFYTHLDDVGNVINNNEITSIQNHEGFPGMAVDPVTGKPMYAWHANIDDDADLEVEFTSDAFMAGISGLFNDITLLSDSPIEIHPPNGSPTNDNAFIWPCMVIGPSPQAGKRRVYVGMRNNTSHAMSGNPSENMYIAFADFDGDDIEMGGNLVWNYTSIPEMDAWNHDTVEFRRPAGTLTVDNAGNLYWAGHHIAYDEDDNYLDEGDMDVFKCPNYGEGTWIHYSAYGDIPTVNPNQAPNDSTGYYTDPDNGDIPYGDNGEMYFGIINSGHINAVVGNDGKLHVPSIWGLRTYNGYYYPALQFVKEFIFDIQTNEFQIKDIYPQQDPDDDFNLTFTPWDIEAPWGDVDEYGGDASSGYYPLMVTAWPFPHWDQTAHDDAMFFHYNGVKLSEPNDHGMMVCVWQDSQRARYYNYYSETDYLPYAQTPEILISVSPNYGHSWSDPINLNNVETPEMSGIKPMYVYPADSVIYTGMQGNNKVGKIGFMFYNDYTWGSHVNSPAYHPNPDGGEVMFMELEIVFALHDPAVDDQNIPPVSKMLLQNYPNPFNPETTIAFDLPQSGTAKLEIYNTKGQLIKTLANGQHDFGRHSYVWNGTDNQGNSVSSGLYFYRLSANGHSESRKMMLMK
ncbi:MAG: T9SS type A sorting domain-containing protein [Candidatus Cloacimonetes bacterium]|nr:T9SS type A sorting domain-containing protein [Candidatus Cloacimonadota bacterium]